VGVLFSNQKEEELKELLYRVYRFVWFLSLPLALGLFSVADHFVPWFYGPGYDKVAVLLKVLCFIIPLIGLSNVTGIQYLMTTKRESFVTRTVCLGAAVNLILNLIFIPQIYSVGAAATSVVAELMITSAQLFLVRKELSIPRILISGWKYMIAVIVMAVALFFEGKLFETGAVGSVVLIISGGVIYLVVLMILRDALLLDTIKSVYHKLRKSS